MKNFRYFLFFTALISLFFGCVPARKVEELEAKKQRCEDDRNNLLSQNKQLESTLKENQAELDDLRRRHKGLVQDTTIKGKAYRTLTEQYDKIKELDEERVKRLKELENKNKAESSKLMGELQNSRESLLDKEDELRRLQWDLEKKEGSLNDLNKELQKREARVKELEFIIKEKDDKVAALKKKVTDALLGYEGKGLTIEQKNGKIYVSLEAKLLFPKGSTAIDQGGRKALNKLSEALENQDDINIMVEGHTDDDPVNGSGHLKDNWDLSVLRATAVVRILLDNKNIDPSRLTASGRGEHLPLNANETKDDKAHNRRIEVILTPNLDELFEILENN
ncbi:MAG: OmpA family protein [Flavobacteriales bacterium]|nr:OmpA family protein [Flavobacteriales bacterium]